MLAALLLLLSAAALITVDPYLSHVLQADWIGDDLKRIILLAEVYAHGSGVAMILLTIAVLHPAVRRSLLRLAVCAFGAGIAANVIKLCVARMRPHSLPDGMLASESFLGLFPLLTAADQPFTHAMQSFPSGHTATAVGLAVGMSRLYPQGRWLFASFAMLASLQRVVVGAHWPSDVLCGAAVGLVVAAVAMDSRVAGRWFDRFEQRGQANNDEQIASRAA
jgi:membrane-associated phospholipid phosphatase